MYRSASLFAALALSTGLAAAATEPTVHFVDLQTLDGSDFYGQFASDPLSAGQAFDDIFLVFSPDVASQIAFDGSADVLRGRAGVSFDGLAFGLYNPVDFPVGVDLALDQRLLSSKLFSGESADFLEAGVYYIELTGTAQFDGASYHGEVFTSAIPEPANLALMLAGVGALGVTARRRRSA